MLTQRSQRLIWIKRIFDSFLYATAVIGVYLSFSGVIPPRNTYIRCDDASISHQWHRDTVSTTLLLVMALFVPFITMVIFEWLNLSGSPSSSPLSKGVRRSSSFFMSLLAGSLFSFFVVEVLKTAVSEPRPHFINSCKPNLTSEVCAQMWIHITWQNCTNPSQLTYSQIIDTMKSFPSGHASIAVFSAVFMTMYIQLRVKVSWSKLLVSWLQLVCWTLTFLCCASRVWDNKHHWWDVVAGGLLGAVPACATVIYLCHWFEDDRKSPLSRDGSPLEQGEVSPSHSLSSKEKNGLYVRAPLEMENATPIRHHTLNHMATEPIIR